MMGGRNLAATRRRGASCPIVAKAGDGAAPSPLWSTDLRSDYEQPRSDARHDEAHLLCDGDSAPWSDSVTFPFESPDPPVRQGLIAAASGDSKP